MAIIDDITPSLPDDGGGTKYAQLGSNPSGIYSVKIGDEYMYEIKTNTTEYAWVAPVKLLVHFNNKSYWMSDVIRFFDGEYLLHRKSTNYPDATDGVLTVSKNSDDSALTCNMYHKDTYYIRGQVSNYKRTGLAIPDASTYTISALDDNYNVQSSAPHYTYELDIGFSTSAVQCNSTYFDFSDCKLKHSTSAGKHYLEADLIFTTKKTIEKDAWKVVIRKKTTGAQTGFSKEQVYSGSFSSGTNVTWSPRVQFETSQFTTGDTVIIDMYIYSGGKWNLTFTRSAPYNSTVGSIYNCLKYKTE